MEQNSRLMQMFESPDRQFRYYLKNRKYFDVQNQTHVPLEVIKKCVLRGSRVTVIELPTKNDITQKTLFKIIQMNEKQSTETLASETLKIIMKIGNGTFSNFLSIYEQLKAQY